MSDAMSKAQYLVAPGQLRLFGAPLLPPGPDEVQIKIRSTTLCGSDLHYYHHGCNGPFTLKEPLVLGHEAAGDIVAVGSQVTELQSGDRVAIECGIPCSLEECQWCRKCRYNLCPKLRFRSSASSFPHLQGTLQEVINHPADWVHKLPASLSYDDGALLEPLAVAIHASRRAELSASSKVLIFGAGPLGLLCAATAERKGCKRVTVADKRPERTQFAMEHGFACAFVIPETGEQGSKELGELVGQNVASVNFQLEQLKPVDRDFAGPDVVFECSGSSEALTAATQVTKRGGRIMLVGNGPPKQSVPLAQMVSREISLIPVFRYAKCYPEAIEHMKALTGEFGEPGVRELITHRVSGLDNVPKAFKLASQVEDDEGDVVMRVAVHI